MLDSHNLTAVYAGTNVSFSVTDYQDCVVDPACQSQVSTDISLSVYSSSLKQTPVAVENVKHRWGGGAMVTLELYFLSRGLRYLCPLLHLSFIYVFLARPQKVGGLSSLSTKRYRVLLAIPNVGYSAGYLQLCPPILFL